MDLFHDSPVVIVQGSEGFNTFSYRLSVQLTLLQINLKRRRTK